MEHQVPADPAMCTPSQRKGRKSAADRSRRVLATVDLWAPELEDNLAEWQHFYNRDGPHDSLGAPPTDGVCDLLRDVPTGEEIAASFNSSREFMLSRNGLRLGPVETM